MNGGSLLKKGLPYDAEIEYLESSGTQWIDTLFYPNNNSFLQLVVQCPHKNDTTIAGAGSKGYTSSDTFEVYYYNGMEFNYGGLYKFLSLPDDFSTVTLDKNIASTDLDTQTFGRRNFSTSNTITLFAVHRNTVFISNNGVKIKQVVIKDNDILVRYFIPVRIGTTGYMYDKVSGQLFGNAGTGAFILGPDKQ